MIRMYAAGRMFVIAIALLVIFMGLMRSLNGGSVDAADFAPVTPGNCDFTTLSDIQLGQTIQDVVDSAITHVGSTNTKLSDPQSLKDVAVPTIQAVIGGDFTPVKERVLARNEFSLTDGLEQAIESYRRYTSLQDFFPAGSSEWPSEEALEFLWNNPSRRHFEVIAICVAEISVGHTKTIDLAQEWNGSRGFAKFTDVVRSDAGRFSEQEVRDLGQGEVIFIELLVRLESKHEVRVRFLYFYDEARSFWAPAMVACEVLPGMKNPLLLF